MPRCRLTTRASIPRAWRPSLGIPSVGFKSDLTATCMGYNVGHLAGEPSASRKKIDKRCRHATEGGRLFRTFESTQIFNNRPDILRCHRGLIVVDHLVDFHRPRLLRQ